ncbi:hypothetical protein EIK77_010489 [Talaromyces pinophilus]|nr:hypothetical protein EIK77_010489 [Talaromyces pinophilus]
MCKSNINKKIKHRYDIMIVIIKWTSSNFGDLGGHPNGTTGLFDELLALRHPSLEAVLTRIFGEVIPDFLLGIRIPRVLAFEVVSGRPCREFGENAGIVDVEDPAEEFDAVDVVLLAWIWFLASIAKPLPP